MENTKEKKYQVSTATALWVDCLVASQQLLDKAIEAAVYQYGEDAEGKKEIMEEITEAYDKVQEAIIKRLGFSVVLNIADLDNLRKSTPEV